MPRSSRNCRPDTRPFSLSWPRRKAVECRGETLRPDKEHRMTILMRSALAVFALVAVALFAVTPVQSADKAEEGFVNLFNGKDLDGWVQRGGKAKYRVEDGQIVGSTVPNTPNSFLCTKKDYGDFILELEFKVQAPLNSGVQI